MPKLMIVGMNSLFLIFVVAKKVPFVLLFDHLKAKSYVSQLKSGTSKSSVLLLFLESY